MTATSPRVPAARERATGAGGVLTGTGTLIRFGLRRDRVRLPVWIAAIFLGTLGTAGNYETTYADADARASIAETMNSPAGLAMSGPSHYLSDYTYGSIMGHQLLGFTAVLVALMTVLTITRHTRTEEETGRAELVRATVVGRYAYLTAALTIATLANTVLAVLMAGGLSGLGAEGFSAEGAALYGAAHAAVGIVFAAVTVVTVQITAHSRGASGMALAAVGAAYALRATGDAVADGGSRWLSWLSPIGWVQRTYVYVDNRWWPLLLCLALAVACGVTGYALSTRRDLGAGLRATRPGRPRASAVLSHPVGFALRLHRGLLVSFGVGLLLLGAMYGSILGDVSTMFENVEVLQEAMNEIGGATEAESFTAMVMMPLSVVAAVYVVLAGLRPRAEETSGRAEPLLATALSRTRWVGSHLIIALLGGTTVMLLAGLSLGATGAASTGDGGLFLRVTGAALAYAPALWVTAGVTVLVAGWLPRAAPVAWVLPVAAFTIGYLGTLLRFPRWLMNLNPFGHVPRLPADSLNWTPLLILSATAAGLIWLGVAGFRHRDLETK